jgi:UDP-N-acetylenolpyruvoylglucosamine reductase
MKILKDIDLKNLSTFNVSAKAKYFVEILKEEDINELIQSDMFKNNSMF